MVLVVVMLIVAVWWWWLWLCSGESVFVWLLELCACGSFGDSVMMVVVIVVMRL